MLAMRNLFIVMVLTPIVALSALAGEIEKYDFKLDSYITLGGELSPQLKFSVREPNEKFKWARYLKAMKNLRNNTKSEKYVYVSIALLDKNHNFLSGSNHPRMKEIKVTPGKNHTINLDFGLAGYSIHDIAYCWVRYIEKDRRVLSWD